MNVSLMLDWMVYNKAEEGQKICNSVKCIIKIKGIRHVRYILYFNPESFYIAEQRAKN